MKESIVAFVFSFGPTSQLHEMTSLPHSSHNRWLRGEMERGVMVL